MNLLTVQEYTTRFGQVEADIVSEVGLDLANVIADAVAIVESYIPANYTVPLPFPPAALKIAASDIARFYVNKDSAPEVVRQRYEDAIALMERVSSKAFPLGIANEVPDVTPEDGNSTGAFFRANPRNFSTWDTAAGSGWDA